MKLKSTREAGTAGLNAVPIDHVENSSRFE